MAEAEFVYLSFLGGGAPILTEAIRRITGIGWPDMISHYRLVRLEVERLGPLTVGIDASGDSVYDRTSRVAGERRAEILAAMRAERERGKEQGVQAWTNLHAVDNNGNSYQRPLRLTRGGDSQVGRQTGRRAEPRRRGRACMECRGSSI